MTRRWLTLVLLLVGLGATVGGVWLDARVRQYLAGSPLPGARIYAAPTVLQAGVTVPGGSLDKKLARLGYRVAAPAAALEAGEFRSSGATLDLAQRPSPSPWAEPARRVRITLRGGRVAELHDLDSGTSLSRLELEPEPLAVLGARGPTLEPGANVAPAACRAAVLAAEDRHFFRHPGINPIAVARALLADLRSLTARQGGSTVSQQLVKNVFLTPRRTLWRKAQEAVLALILEARATKEEILRRYMAAVYLGVDASLPVYGFAEASEVYFAKPVGQLGVSDCALLAGMIRAPNALAPRRHPRAALARRNRVLNVMARDGALDWAASERAMAAPLGVVPARPRPVANLYVAAEVNSMLHELVPEEVEHASGLAIFTTVDADAQRAAERAVRRGLDTLEGRRRRRERLQAALVALDPANGEIRALVGGRDFGSSPLDRAVRARRQPGSAFKPFVYLAALDPARRSGTPAHTVMSLLDDVPVRIRSGAEYWQPANYDGTFAGRVPLAEALAESRNSATVQLALDVGVDAVIQAATDLGLGPSLPRVPALALGVAETSLLELTAAYGVFAAGGIRRPPVLITAIAAPSGELLYTAPRLETRVLTPAVAYLMTHLLEHVIDEGTGRGARAAGVVGAAAGKTGTTDETRDAWFIGYTPAVVAGVWVGLDAGGPTGFTGAQAALPIWADFVRTTPTARADGFAIPDGIVWRVVDAASGGLATASCPATRREPFLIGTEPRALCARHAQVRRPVGDDFGDTLRDGGRALGSGGRRIRDWFRRLFR